MFSDPRFQALHVGYARIDLRWDVLSDATATAQLDLWMNGAKATGARPLVTFDRSPKRISYNPTPQQLVSRMKALRSALPVPEGLLLLERGQHEQEAGARREVVAGAAQGLPDLQRPGDRPARQAQHDLLGPALRRRRAPHAQGLGPAQLRRRQHAVDQDHQEAPGLGRRRRSGSPRPAASSSAPTAPSSSSRPAPRAPRRSRGSSSTSSPRSPRGSSASTSTTGTRASARPARRRGTRASSAPTARRARRCSVLQGELGRIRRAGR